jgi:hypothetical protein
MFDRPALKCPPAASVHIYTYLVIFAHFYLFILFNSRLFDDAVSIQDYIQLDDKTTGEW